jgi:hypothetical protein
MAIIKKILQGVLGLKKDPNATTQDTAVIQAEDTNSGIAIVPNGTGAITAQVPDGTIAKGGPRGDYAIDFQRARTTTNQGALGSRSGVFAGFNHNVTSLAGVIAGGRNNIVTSEHGGVFTGQSNTAGSNSHATVVGGRGNISSGQYSVSGGYQSTASGAYSVALGDDNTVSGARSVAMGQQSEVTHGASLAMGFRCEAKSSYSQAFGADTDTTANFATAFGYAGKGYLSNSLSLASYINVNTPGYAQGGFLVRTTTDTLTTGATTIVASDLIPEGSNRVWNVVVDTTAVVTAETATSGIATGDVYSETTKLTFKKIGGVSSIVGTLSQNAVYDGGMDTATMNFSVGSSQELQIEFQAPMLVSGDITVRVVSKVSLVEVAY